MKELDQKIDKLVGLLAAILGAIFFAAVAIAIGTPLAAILIYRNRGKLFPKMKQQEFPAPKALDKVASVR